MHWRVAGHVMRALPKGISTPLSVGGEVVPNVFLVVISWIHIQEIYGTMLVIDSVRDTLWEAW